MINDIFAREGSEREGEEREREEDGIVLRVKALKVLELLYP